VVTSWYQRTKEFKSPTYVVAAFLLRSREGQVAINQRLRKEIKELRTQLDRQAQQWQQQQQQESNASRQQVAELRKELEEARQSVNLPEDRPVATHGYGTRMISLAVNLARSVGLRGAE